MNKIRVVSVKVQLRAVARILRAWDPIGVIVDPDAPEGPLDEYDSYAPSILGKLQSGIDVNALAQNLNELATARMGLHGNIDRDRIYAEQLVTWWKGQGHGADAA